MIPKYMPSNLHSFFFNYTAPTEIYTLSLHDALPISPPSFPIRWNSRAFATISPKKPCASRSEEHTSELQSHVNLVCRLLLEKKKQGRARNSAKDCGRGAERSGIAGGEDCEGLARG